MAERPRVVIIGGGFGGLTAARSLKRANVSVTLIDRSNHHLFQPLLYQVATAGLGASDIAVPIRAVFRNQENTRVLLGEVTRVSLGERMVHLDDGLSLPYDQLIVAVGAKTNYFGHEEWSRYALGLKTLDDAIAVRRHVLLAFEAAEREPDPVARKRLLTFVVIGGGPTGVEVAGSLSELGRFVLSKDFRQIRNEKPEVILIEAGDRLLAGGFVPELSEKAKVQLEELGVQVHLKSAVTSISDHGVRFGDRSIDASTVVWTAGVRAKRLADALGVEVDRGHRVKVLQDCSVPGHPEVFAIGDVSVFVPEGKTVALPGVSPVAMQQARFVAKVIRARAEGKEAPTRFEYFDKGMMATIGRSRAVAQTGKLRMSGLLAWFAWLFVHIFYLIDFRNRIAVLIDWGYSYIAYKRGARIITGEKAWEGALALAAAAENPMSLPKPEQVAPSAPLAAPPPS
jgi:NADH dehydrogenase